MGSLERYDNSHRDRRERDHHSDRRDRHRSERHSDRRPDRHSDRRSHRGDQRARSRSRSLSPYSARQRLARAPELDSGSRGRYGSSFPPADHKYDNDGGFDDDGDSAPFVKERPNFNLTGLLAKEANTVEGTDVVLKYQPPADAADAAAVADDWWLYSFAAAARRKAAGGGEEDGADGSGAEDIPPIELSARTHWVFGTERRAVGVQLAHDSVDEQHAAIQFRKADVPVVPGEGDDGDDDDEDVDDQLPGDVDPLSRTKRVAKPYLIDLESKRGTRLNGKKIPPSRFVELKENDVVTFARDRREWVLVKSGEKRETKKVVVAGEDD